MEVYAQFLPEYIYSETFEIICTCQIIGDGVVVPHSVSLNIA